MSSTGTTDHEATGPRGARHERDAADRLLRAATRSGAHLIAEAASLVQGWAVLADPIAGAVYSTPAAAAADGVHAAAAPREHPHCTQRPAAGAVLVLAAAPTVPPGHACHVATTTAALLEVRGQRAAELRGEQMRLHTTLIRLLLAGHTAAVTETLGANRLTHVTVYRLSGVDLPTAHEVLWRAVRPSLAPYAGACTLMGRRDGELVVAELHRGGDDGRILRLVSRLSERQHLLAGMAGPLPLAEMPTAHSDAAAARHSATPDRRVVPADAVGASRLTPCCPSPRTPGGRNPYCVRCPRSTSTCSWCGSAPAANPAPPPRSACPPVRSGPGYATWRGCSARTWRTPPYGRISCSPSAPPPPLPATTATATAATPGAAAVAVRPVRPVLPVPPGWRACRTASWTPRRS